MGEDLIPPDPSFTDIFEAQQALYLSMGMSLSEFWDGPPELAKVYRDAEYMREHRENARAWRNGLYMMHALNATVMNVFRRKGTSPSEYVSEPFPLSQRELEQREERDAALAEQRIRDRLQRRAAEKTVSKV